MIRYNDQELLYLYRCGSEEAQDCLFNNYYICIMYWMKSFSNYHHLGLDYEDFVQVGMMCFWNTLMNYREDKGTSLYTYVKSSVFKKAYGLIETRREKNALADNIVISLDEPIAHDGYSYEDIIGDPSIQYQPQLIFQVRETTDTYLHNFDQNATLIERQVMYYMLEGYDVTEISEILQVPIKKVYNAAYRSHKKMTIDENL